MSRVSLDRVEWIDLNQERLKLVFRGKDGELMQSVAEIENEEQRLFAMRIFATALTITKALRAEGIVQVQPPAE